jgi:transposase
MTTMDVAELLRVLREGTGDRASMKLLHYNRRTIAKYRRWAQQQGLLEGPLPATAELHQLLERTLPRPLPPQQTSSLAAYATEIAEYRARGMELAAIRVRLEERHGHPVSYSAVRRVAQRLQRMAPPAASATDTFVRVEVAPGREAQVDFGYAGWTLDPATNASRKTWVFVMVLSWSRHLYAELVFDQKVETWLLCHRHAFEWFGGVPARVVPDNLKAAILHTSFHDPVVQRSYRECAEHYGFLIDPNPPRTPRLKGKVEQGGVHYVKRNFLAGRTPPQPVDELNRALRVWATQTAGHRIHGTTRQRPLEQFEAIERAALRPSPTVPYDPAIWKQVLLHRDGYIVFEQAYYSAPCRLVGQTLWVRGGARTVELFTADHQLVATHTRARAPGERQTHLSHLPPEKVPGLILTREGCQAQANAIGPATATLVQELLDHRPVDRLRVAGRLLRLAQTHSPERLERACTRARHFCEPDYATIKRILQERLNAAALAVPPSLPPSAPAAGAPATSGASAPESPRYAFVRQAGEFVASLFGGGGPGSGSGGTGSSAATLVGLAAGAAR